MQTKSLQTKRALRTAMLVLLLGVAGMGKGYAQGEIVVIGDLRCYVEGRAVKVLGHKDGHNATGELVFPPIVINGYVGWPPHYYASIADNAFAGCSGLTGSLILPEKLSSIGANAFSGCSGLTSLSIGKSVTTIGQNAFYACSNLESISVETDNNTFDSRDNCNAIIKTSTNELLLGCKNTIIPNSVTTIGSSAFYGCSGLASITIPNSVTTIGSSAFYGCCGLASITIPNSVTTIGSSAFYGCSGLTSITNSNSVNTIGSFAFYGCSGLTSIIIPNSVTTIGESTFYGCRGLASITIPNSVTSIGSSAFYGCSGLTLVTVGNSVIFIGANAFFSCSGLASITIPNSVRSIGDGAFYNCFSLTEVHFNATNCSDANGSPFFGCGGTLTIGENVIRIPNNMFSGAAFNGSLTIPNSVTTIGDNSFKNCTAFTGSLIIGSSVTSIGSDAFYSCSGFTGSLTIGNSVTTIGENAFRGCNGFTGNLNIPNSVISIGKYAFYGCSGFSGLTISNRVSLIDEETFRGCIGLTSVTIPNQVSSIGYQAFCGCSSLISATMNNVNSIGENAFYGCSSLITVIIPNTVNSIGKNAFSNTAWYAAQPAGSILYLNNWCLGYKAPQPTGLLAFHGDTRGIVEEAFIGCNELTSISIPNTVVVIGNNAFKNCNGLKEISFDAKDCIYDIWSGCLEVTTIVLGDFVESVKANMFSNFENLTTVTIGKSVKSIEWSAFANNPRLNMVYYNVEKDLEAPTNVFENCPNLTTIHIGPEVKEIGSNIFKGCNTVHFVVALGPTPAVLDAGAFSDIVDNSVLMVSCGKRVTYYSVWNMFPFNNIIEDCDTYGINVGAVGSGGTITPSVTEAQMGQEVQITITPNPGMVLVSIKVVNANDPTQIIPISPSGKAASTYSFTMPPFEVVVMATFKSSGASVNENNSVEVAVYPNPTNGLVKIEAESIKHITISNMLGQVVFDGKVGGDAFEYDFSGQKAGIYLVRIETASGVAVKKVSVTR